MKEKSLKAEHDIELDDNIKVALLTAFLSSDLQNFIFQWWDGKQKFADVKDCILALAVNRVSMCRLAPMEVDRVQKTRWWDEDLYQGHSHDQDVREEAWKPEEEAEIGYIGESCRRCGGMEHYAARECPTPKGKGKGGGGKGGGKAGGTGKSGGQQASECPNNRAAMEIGSVEEDEMTVGGVWKIAQVKVESDGEAYEDECDTEVKSDWREHMKTYLKEDKWVEVTCNKRNRKMNRFTKAKKQEAEVKAEKLEKHICGVMEASAAEESVCPKK